MLKEKESIVKNELIKGEKVIELEDLFAKTKQEKDELFLEIAQKEKTIS